MIYTFKCECGYARACERSIKVGAPARVKCTKCGKHMDRDWKADLPMMDTSNCKDHNFIPHDKRVASAFDRGGEVKMERRFQESIANRRKEIREAGGQRGSIRQSHQIPAHLFHGKIRETGDRRYWDDPKNLAKHNDCKVDP